MFEARSLAAALFIAGTLLEGVPPLAAQKVAVAFNKSIDFGRYKRFAWRENYLITVQHPEDQKRIDAVLRESIERQLRAKGFVQDHDRPDFFVSYEAGGFIQDGVGVRPDTVQPNVSTMTWSSAYPAGAPMDVWTSTLAKMRITMSDASDTSLKIWQATASQKIDDPQKFMRKMPQNIESVSAKLLKDFPPAAKR